MNAWIIGLGGALVAALVVAIGCRRGSGRASEDRTASQRHSQYEAELPTIRFEDFLAPVPRTELVAMLAEWQWLPISELRPVAMTIMGDVLLVDRANKMYFLDTSFGVLERVADSNEQFGQRLNSEEGFSRELLRSDLLIEIQSTGVITSASHAGTERGAAAPAPGQVFGFAVPLIAGGISDAANVIVTSAAVYMDMQGQITQFASTLEPGTEFAVEFEGWPQTERPPADAQRRRLVRARRDRRAFALHE